MRHHAATIDHQAADKARIPSPAQRHVELRWAILYRPDPGKQPGRERLLPHNERCELVTQGRGWIMHEDTWVEITAGSLIWNVAGDYTIGRTDPGNPFACLAVDFAVTSRPLRPAPRLTRWEDAEERDSFIRQIHRATAVELVDRTLLGSFIYTSLLLQTHLWTIRSKRPAIPPQLRRIKGIIDERYADQLDISALARSVAWSPSHLHAEFRRHLATSPHQYLLRRRIQAVCEALQKFDHGLQDIARTTGFANVQSLVRAFRRHTGETPLRWRARHG